jgi:hypothetical protein
MHASLARLTAPLAIAAGLGWAADGILELRWPQPDHHWHATGYLVEIAFAVALVPTIALLTQLAADGSRAARVAARAAQLGFGALLVSSCASIAAGGNTLGPAFLLGILVTLLGLLVLSATSIRARGALWWAAPLVLAGLVASMALAHGGAVVFGVAWLVVAIALRERDPAPRAVNVPAVTR